MRNTLTPSALRAAILAMATVLAAPTAALEPHQREAIDRMAAALPSPKAVASVMARHYALLLWVEDYCEGRSVESVRNYALSKGSADRDSFEAGWMDTFAMLATTDPKAMCALALEVYGPAGTQIRGAWAPRK